MAEVASSAQDIYATVMRRDVAPLLRRLGLQGSGQTYELPSPHTWALLGFQKSRYNTTDQVRFTVNLTVADKSDWAAALHRFPEFGTRPRVGMNYGRNASVWTRRIGDFMPTRKDQWWEITPATDSAALAHTVCEALTIYAVPALVAQTEAARQRSEA